MKKTINHNGIDVIDLDSIRSSKYDENIERYGDDVNTCFICGKPTAKNLYIHFSTAGFIVPADIDETELDFRNLESQGCFPVGSECAKKIGKIFVFNQIA